MFNTSLKLNINAKINDNTKEENEVSLVENILNNNEKSNIQSEIKKNEYNPGKTEDLQWLLKIQKIDLKAEISEGTTPEVLNKYIGHFINTPKENGNIVLAAHNRGYAVNYFERLKELEIGDEIIYIYNGNDFKYIVESKTIIKDTQIEVLENTKDNILTLITCVENEPEYRRCIKANLKNRRSDKY